MIAIRSLTHQLENPLRLPDHRTAAIFHLAVHALGQLIGQHSRIC
jgi:hypothetical protein